jgi:hypothetical protein
MRTQMSLVTATVARGRRTARLTDRLRPAGHHRSSAITAQHICGQAHILTYSLGLYLHIHPNKHFPFVRKPASPQRISRSGLDMS